MPSVRLLLDNIKLCWVAVAGLGFQKAPKTGKGWKLQLGNEPGKNREWDHNPNPGDLLWGYKETVL